MASTKERILGVVSANAGEEGWWNYDLDVIATEITDKARNNLQVQVSELAQRGQLEVEREGRFIKRVRLAQSNTVEQIKKGSKSHTEQMLHYLFGLADEKGNIPKNIASIDHLQRVFKRDYHDTNKALHNLNKLGILEIAQSKNAGAQARDHRITRMRLRLERQKSWPIELLTDEELPGKTDIDYEEEMQELEPVEEIGTTEMVERQVEFHTDDPVVAQVLDNATIELQEESDFATKYPLIAGAVSKHLKRVKALQLLDDTDEEIGSLLAEKMREEDPMIKELISLAGKLGYYG